MKPRVKPPVKSMGPLMRTVFAAVVLLGALALVPWRQSRALEALASLDQLRREASEAAAKRVDLERTIQVLESRGRVVPLARERLGMHTPSATELVILPGDPNP